MARYVNGVEDVNYRRKMSDPFRDGSTPPLDDVQQRKLDDFTNQKLSNYVVDVQNAPERDLPESPVKSAAAHTRQQPANVKKTRSAKGKTPVHAIAKVPQTPVRKSPRTGTKRKIFEGNISDAEEHSPTPLTKKSKTAKATTRASLGGAGASTAVNPGKKILPALKPKATLASVAKSQAATSKPHAGPSKKRPRTPEEDYDEDSDSAEAQKAKKGKKKNASEEEFKEFEASANSDGQGSSTSRPQHAELDEPWKCANRTCSTGMTWFERGNGTSSGYGRKACSHWFGRNKKETGYIHAEVWHWFCRKCYQRSQYQAKSNKSDTPGNALVKQHVDTLRVQIVRLEFWRPDMTFKVQLFKAAKDRLGEYHKALHRTGASEADAINAVKFVSGTTSKGKESTPRSEQHFPIKLIEHFDYTYVGHNKTYSDLIDICDWIDKLNENGEAPCDPPVEFLPSAEVEGERVIDPVGPPDNYDRWTTHCDRPVEEASESDDDDDEGDQSGDERDHGNKTVDGKLDDAEEAGDDSLSDSDDDYDDAPPTRKAPLSSSSGLKITALGMQLGLTGRNGIVRGSGIRAEREAQVAAANAATESARTESPEVEVKTEE